MIYNRLGMHSFGNMNFEHLLSKLNCLSILDYICMILQYATQTYGTLADYIKRWFRSEFKISRV